MLKEVYTKEAQQKFLDGLTAFNKDAEKMYGSPFLECQPSEQIELVKKYNSEAITTNSPERPFILTMKELTLTGFFTSEVGATQVLQYNQVPGPYQGCVDLSVVGKTWAT